MKNLDVFNPPFNLVTCDVCKQTDADFKLMLIKLHNPERMQCVDCSAKQDGFKINTAVTNFEVGETRSWGSDEPISKAIVTKVDQENGMITVTAALAVTKDEK